MASPNWKRLAKRSVKGAVAVAVLWAVGLHVRRTWTDLQAQGEGLSVDALWVAAGAALYLAGLVACGAFYGRILRATATPISMASAIRAYVVSHLGKYVPGKAMVVVMRVGLSVPQGARASTAAIATFYETLVMMASGALVAVVGFALAPRPTQLPPILLASALALAFLIVVEPRLFPRIARLASTPFKGVGPDAYPKFSFELLATGMLWTILGWTLMGLSQVAVVRAFSPDGVPTNLWPLIGGSVALATVAGFVVAVLPGGLGVREWVLMTAMAPALGEKTAVVSALALRLTWVLAEAVGAGVLASWRPRGMATTTYEVETALIPASGPTEP